MVAFEVHVQQLLLSEGLFTLAAGIRFLSGMGSAMHHHVALLDAAPWEKIKLFKINSTDRYSGGEKKTPQMLSGTG